MIQHAYVTEWRAKAPWALDEQVEQDLIIARAIVAIFSEQTLQQGLAFRGGTALHKLWFPIAARYSEDIDLVQVHAGPIGNLLSALHQQLDCWLGPPKWKQGRGRITLYYQYAAESEPPQTRRLKVEINSREHFSTHGLIKLPFAVASRWWSGQTLVTSYNLEELLGTKMRALYQRKKGRDLFDLWCVASRLDPDPQRIVDCFLRYLAHDGLCVSRAEFEANLLGKIADPVFQRDIAPLIASTASWDPAAALDYVLDHLLPLLPGESWKGSPSPA